MYIILLSALALAALGALLLVWQKNKRLQKEKETAERERQQLEVKLHSLELESIRYKLNPHLFKNTLNSILSHAYQTYHSLDKMSEVLDYILYGSDQQLVPLKNEMDFVLNFIEINKLKLSPLFNLQVKNNLAGQDALLNHVIAPLITVDLIENAFKHADIQNPDAFISIVFDWKDDVFHLVVSNKISAKEPLRKTNSGFGRENFGKRLQIVYPGMHELNAYTRDEIYTAHLKINLREHHNKMLAAGR